jgi:hypothetical protein
MKPHKRIDPVGRVCMVCGRGQRPRLGGCAGFKPALIAAGYVWDHNETLGFAHLSCITRALKRSQ